MDTDQLITHGRARFEHHVAKKLLKEKYEAKMVFAYNGGMFRAGPELLTLLEAVPVEDEVVITDLYENPIKINPIEMKGLVFSRWQEQMNAWLVEFDEIKKNR